MERNGDVSKMNGNVSLTIEGIRYRGERGTKEEEEEERKVEKVFYPTFFHSIFSFV